jgi:hypothetical protein
MRKSFDLLVRLEIEDNILIPKFSKTVLTYTKQQIMEV